MLSVLRPLAIVACLATASGASSAGEAVLFNDGRVLEIDGHDSDAAGNWVLRLAGGRTVVPKAKVVAFRLDPGDPSAPSDHDAPSLPAPETLDQLAARLASELQVEPRLVAAVIAVESAGDPSAVSPKGAAGLMQLMPATARRLGVGNVFEPTDNLKGGILYLKALLERYHGDLARALAAYNAGEGAVDRHHGIPPYRETTRYVIRVLREYLASAAPAREARP